MTTERAARAATAGTGAMFVAFPKATNREVGSKVLSTMYTKYIFYLATSDRPFALLCLRLLREPETCCLNNRRDG